MAYNTKRSDLATAQGELSYYFGRVGLIGKYQFSDNTQVTSFQKSADHRHQPRLLLHLKLPAAYLRLGGGGGAWSERLQLFEEAAATVTRGAIASGWLEADGSSGRSSTCTVKSGSQRKRWDCCCTTILDGDQKESTRTTSFLPEMSS